MSEQLSILMQSAHSKLRPDLNSPSTGSYIVLYGEHILWIISIRLYKGEVSIACTSQKIFRQCALICLSTVYKAQHCGRSPGCLSSTTPTSTSSSTSTLSLSCRTCANELSATTRLAQIRTTPSAQRGRWIPKISPPEQRKDFDGSN